MNRPPFSNEDLAARRRRARRLAVWVALAAVAVYAGFIVINLPSA
jgi:hypothetical protein